MTNIIQARILLADPDEELLEHYGQSLVQDGFDVETVTNGLDCLNCLREFEPDVLVLEPELPWGQGEDVLAVMRDESDVPLVPVIILSRNWRLEESRRSLEFPIREFLVKPVTPKGLAYAIQRLLYSRLPERAAFGNRLGLAQEAVC